MSGVMEVVVENGIAMPEVVRGARVRWPYEVLEVGESFVVPGEGKNLVVGVCARNKKWGDKLGRRFTAKRVEGGVRVWRVS